MMKPIRPNISKGGIYPPEFREEAVRYWLSSGQKLVTVASELGLSPQCLRDWRKSMESNINSAAQTSSINSDSGNATDLSLAREIGQLRRELEAMTRQRDILKPAGHFKKGYQSCPFTGTRLRRQDSQRSRERRFEVIQDITQASTSTFQVREACAKRARRWVYQPAAFTHIATKGSACAAVKITSWPVNCATPLMTAGALTAVHAWCERCVVGDFILPRPACAA